MFFRCQRKKKQEKECEKQMKLNKIKKGSVKKGKTNVKSKRLKRGYYLNKTFNFT